VEHLEAARSLFLEYAELTGFCACFQSFACEVAGLPGKYAPPAGRLLLAEITGQPGGCVALRGMSEDVGEMKRLYVRPAYRNRMLGRQLAEAATVAASQIGYRIIRLDTLTSMTAARGLYRSLGFQIIPPYDPNPNEGVLSLEFKLERRLSMLE
jgi:putative acetyltransferase